MVERLRALRAGPGHGPLDLLEGLARLVQLHETPRLEERFVHVERPAAALFADELREQGPVELPGLGRPARGEQGVRQVDPREPVARIALESLAIALGGGI